MNSPPEGDVRGSKERCQPFYKKTVHLASSTGSSRSLIPARTRSTVRPMNKLEAVLLVAIALLAPKNSNADEPSTPPAAAQKSGLSALCTRTNVRFILSANICAGLLQIKTAKDEIKEEYALARTSGGGLIDKKYVYLRQSAIGSASRQMKTFWRTAATMRLKMLPCSTKGINDLAECLNDPSLDGCRSEAITEWMSLIYNIKKYDPELEDPDLYTQPLSKYESDHDKEPLCQ